MTWSREDRLKFLVAQRLGIEPELARELLQRMRSRFGRRDFWIRATAFSVLARKPLAAMMPDALAGKALESFLGPLLGSPSALNAFAGQSPLSDDLCAGLLREPLALD